MGFNFINLVPFYIGKKKYKGGDYSYGDPRNNNWEVVQKAFDLLKQAGYVIHYMINEEVNKVSDFECLKELMIAQIIERNAMNPIIKM